MSQRLNYDKYDYYCCIYLDDNLINLSIGSNLNQQVEASFALSHFERHPAAFTYDRKTGDVIDWGHAAEETFVALQRNNDDDFTEETYQSSKSFQRSISAEIYRLYQSQDKNPEINLQDEIRFKAIARFLGAVCKQAYDSSPSRLSNSHFVFIIPTEWDRNITAQFIPRLLEYGDIIMDDPGCIMFFTVLESIVAATQEKSYFDKHGIAFSIEEKYLSCDLYLEDTKLPAKIVLQAFQVESEQRLIDSPMLPDQTKPLFYPKLAGSSHRNIVELISCEKVLLKFEQRNAHLIKDISADTFVEKFINEAVMNTEEEFGRTSNDSKVSTLRNLDVANLVTTNCEDSKKLVTAIDEYLYINGHRHIDSIIFTIHDNLHDSEKYFSHLYLSSVFTSLKSYQYTKFHLLGESRWAKPHFGGVEILRGGLLKLLESLKFANSECLPTIERMKEVSTDHYQDQQFSKECTHPDCNWSFTRYDDAARHSLLHEKKDRYTCFCGMQFKSKEAFYWHCRSKDICTLASPLYFSIDISFDSTNLLFAKINNRYEATEEIKLMSTFLASLPPLKTFIKEAMNTGDKLKLDAEWSFYQMDNDLYHKAFQKYCEEKQSVLDKRNPGYHDIKELSQEFKFEDYYRHLTQSNLIWGLPDQNMKTMKKLEAIYNNTDETTVIGSNDSNHIATFILLYIGYVYHKLEAELECEKIYSPLGKTALIVLQDQIHNALPSKIAGNHELLLKLCGLHGRVFAIVIKRTEFALARLHSTLQGNGTVLSNFRSYYIHSRIGDKQVELSLCQIVHSKVVVQYEITPLSVKDLLVEIADINDSISTKLWPSFYDAQHFRSNSNKSSKYSTFSVEIIDFICKVISDEPNYDKRYLFESSRAFEVDQRPLITLRDIVEVAIRPTMKTIALAILSTLKNIDAFACYNVGSMLVTGDLLSSYYHLKYRRLLALILKKELLEQVKSRNYNLTLMFAMETSKFDSNVKNVGETLDAYEEHLTKQYTSTKSKYNYALKFNYTQDLFKDSRHRQQQTALECSDKESMEVSADQLYILLTQNTLLCQFSRLFLIRSDNASILENIELVQYKEKKRPFVAVGRTIPVNSVTYTVVHRFLLDEFYRDGKDPKFHQFPLVVNVSPVDYLSLLEISLKIKTGEKSSSHFTTVVSVLREKQTLYMS